MRCSFTAIEKFHNVAEVFMSPRSKGSSGATGGISVGNSVQGSALNTGNNSVQTVGLDSSTNDERAELLITLREIHAALEKLSGPFANAARQQAQTAIEAASGDKVDKTAIGSALENAMGAAKKTAEFAGAAAKLAPLLQTAVTWLGTQWVHLTAIAI
jgi:hypothetical protein